jgi:hypothetical protein
VTAALDGSTGGTEAARNLDCAYLLEQARAEEGYFRARMLESVRRAGESADSLARLAHYELAGRYSLAALATGGRPSPDRCERH